MALASKKVYARLALDQVPRLLGNQDRNSYSPTYGCFHRDYWLDKTSDFADAVRQFGVHSLALVYKHDFPGNIYKGKAKVRDWALAGLDFWAGIQHQDGSFDEFYPFERGWVGPTAFTTFTSIEAFRLLQDEIPHRLAARLQKTIRRAAYFIAAGESEEDHLGNHHAMACLAVWKAYECLGDPGLKEAYERLWQVFLGYHNREEGWSREYDGVDPGYLSATVSFLGKIYQSNPDPRILEVVEKSLEFCSYFVYPNGFYAGSLGSRNTLHFYPHGFEVFAEKIPLAGAIAEKMLLALSDGKLVPPGIMSDRYVFYRVPEYLQAFLDHRPRGDTLPPVPYEGPDFQKYFPGAKIWIEKREKTYGVANLAKGGVLKVFNCDTGDLVFNDCGIIGRLRNGAVVTTQWIDPAYQVKTTDHGWEVSGHMNVVPSHKLFTPLKNMVFRAVLLLIGWNQALSHSLKGRIRKMLMLGNRRTSVFFKRTLAVTGDRMILTDELKNDGKSEFLDLSFGDEFFVRYVPQSRYFQAQELDVYGAPLNNEGVARLNRGDVVSRTEVIDL